MDLEDAYGPLKTDRVAVAFKPRLFRLFQHYKKKKSISFILGAIGRLSLSKEL
jgi:hypothetical protein